MTLPVSFKQYRRRPYGCLRCCLGPPRYPVQTERRFALDIRKLTALKKRSESEPLSFTVSPKLDKLGALIYHDYHTAGKSQPTSVETLIFIRAVRSRVKPCTMKAHFSLPGESCAFFFFVKRAWFLGSCGNIFFRRNDCMACFLVSAAEAVAVTAATKAAEKILYMC